LKTVAIVVKADTRARHKADELQAWLDSRGVAVVRQELGGSEAGAVGVGGDEIAPGVECLFVLGGDGTFLSAVRWIGERAIPILGVKFGEIGFLAEVTEEHLFPTADAILRGDYETEQRMRLQVEVWRGAKCRIRERVLNDLVINKGTLARLANIETYINDHFLTTYRADGLIVATPTGSTAYSLAAGGPVIHPAVPGIIMTPICPFTLTNRPLIIPDAMRIRIRLEKQSQGIMLTFDGQVGFAIDDTDEIIIGKGPRPVEMIRVPHKDYFSVLKAKLRWSGGRV
jgi:NAD+ kinase